MKKHPHCENIIAWANGEEIEYFDDSYKQWFYTPFPSWQEKTKYRIKPKTCIPYRRYLINGESGILLTFVHKNNLFKYNPETSNNFIRWIDEDWITHEV